MQNVRWDLLPGVIPQVLFNIAMLALFVTVFGALALKYFVRPVPLISHAIIFFWATFRVLFVVSAIWLAVVILGIPVPSTFSGLFSLAGMCVVGWLVSRDIEKRYGIPAKFPGPGFKSVLSVLVLSWIFVGAYFLLARS